MVIPSEEGIQRFSLLFWIPAGVYPGGNRDGKKNFVDFLMGK
jgi:hypothetical protein